MNKVYNFLKKYWVIMIIFIIPLPSLFWLPDGTYLAHGLIYPWPDSPTEMFKIANLYLYTWISGGMGMPNTEPSGFLYFFISAIFSALGGGAHLGQSLFFYFGFVGILAGMYYLARILGLSRLSSFISGTFYLLSPFVFSGMPIESVNLRLIPYLILSPLMLAVFIKALKGQSFGKWLAIFGVTCLLATAGYGSLQYFILNILVLLIYVIFAVISRQGEKKYYRRLFVRLALLLVVMFLANFYWISNFLANLSGTYNLRIEPGLSLSHDNDFLLYTSSQIINALRMLPYIAQQYSTPWLSYYYHPLVIIIEGLLLSLIPLSFVFRKTRKLALFPVIWLIIALFFIKGGNDPFSYISKVIFLSFPYITRLFRNMTYFELIVIPPLSLLVGLSLGNILRSIINGKSRLLLSISMVVVSTIFIIWGMPFIFGVALLPISTTSASQYNILPEYYKDAMQFLKNNKEINRAVTVPSICTKACGSFFQWGLKYSGIHLDGFLSEKPVYQSLFPYLVGEVSPEMEKVNHPQNNIIGNAEFNMLLATGNVRYLIFHKDVAWDLLYQVDPEKYSILNEKDIQGFLSGNDAIKKVKTFDKIDIYEVLDDYFLPRFYTPKSIFILEEDMSDFSKIFSQSNYQLRSAIYSKSQHNNNIQLKNLVDKQNKEIESEKEVSQWFVENKEMGEFYGGYCKDWIKLPVLEFKKVNPTKYKVLVHGATDIFPLIDSESFQSSWKVYLTKSQISLRAGGNLKSQISDDKYFISKNIQGTIQNDGLSNGAFYENWFKKPIIDEQDHLVTNIYANSWIVDPVKICQNSSQCVENSDGSYDLELTIEYQTQKMFYIGMAISGTVVFGCIIYLLISTICKKKKRKTRKCVS